ncbi:MAG TPA: Rid family detoxifying hydrolase [Bacteroidota bacterium]
MKYVIAWVLAITLLSCKSDQDLRTMMREEIAKSSAKTFFPSQDVIGPYTPAVQAGPLLFVSGQIGINPQTGDFAGTDVESQTKQALTNLFTLLGKAGFDSSDVVQCSVFLKDMNDFQHMNLIYGGFFAEGRYPTRTTVEVSNLPKNARIEISAIAYRSK